MNEVIKAMKERRSIRRFKPDMPKKEDLGVWGANERALDTVPWAI